MAIEFIIDGGNIVYCRHCGKEIEEDSKFCKYCGGNVSEKTAVGKIENREKKVEKQTLEPTRVNGVDMSSTTSEDDDEANAEFIEDDIEQYKKVTLSPAMKKKLEEQKREEAKKEEVNRKLRKAVVRNLMARKKEEEINKLGNNAVDMYKRHRKPE